MAKPNYRHAKKQKEAARKARQDAKQQRRAAIPAAGEAIGGEAAEGEATPATAAAPAKTDI